MKPQYTITESDNQRLSLRNLFNSGKYYFNFGKEKSVVPPTVKGNGLGQLKLIMKEIFLIKEGEIALKGLNRTSFEELLIKNLRVRLKSLGEFQYHRAQSTITVEPAKGIDPQTVEERISTVYGIAAFSRAAAVPKDFDIIAQTCLSYIKEELLSAKTFKVFAKRSDKHFPKKSPEICAELGGFLLEHFPHLSVDVHNPDVTVIVEIRDTEAYLYARRIQGAGGIPVGSSGEGMLLLSGGIDSPVAGAMMAKRGMRIQAVHFVSPPYTSDRALKKVEELGEIMAKFCGPIPFHCVPFTKIQEQIKQCCPEELFTIIMRRMMMRIAQKLVIQQNEGGRRNLQALITGESLGQVASQTIGAMVCTDAVCDIPVLRPQVGLDKNEIVKRAREIGTFETSILPYEDCCTVFTPKHPKTRPQLSVVEDAETAFDFEPLLQEAVKQTRFSMLYPNWF